MIDLKQRRTALKMTLEQVAEKVGVSRQAICAFEQHKSKPKIDTAKKLGLVLGVPWFEIYE